MRLRWTVGIVAGFCLLSLAVADQAYAQGPKAIFACVNNSSGEVRIVAPGTVCKHDWTLKTWNEGPAGGTNVQQLFNDTPGPLPSLLTPFTSNGGTLVIFASGSGYFNKCVGAGVIGMAIFVDGTQRGTERSFTNESCSHKAFVSNALVVTGVGSGAHTLQLSPLDNTTTDFNDFYSVTVMELSP